MKSGESTLIMEPQSISFFRDCFQKIAHRKDDLKPCSVLRSFNQAEVKPERVISLPVTIGTKLKRATSIVDFHVIKADSPYNAILSQSWLTPNKVIYSTYHRVMKFPTVSGITDVWRHQ